MPMQINIRSSIDPEDATSAQVEALVASALERFGDQITRVEVHLTDVNGEKSRGADKRCLIEVRPAGRKPVAVTHLAHHTGSAVSGAVDRMARLLDGAFGLRDGKREGDPWK